VASSHDNRGKMPLPQKSDSSCLEAFLQRAAPPYGATKLAIRWEAFSFDDRGWKAAPTRKMAATEIHFFGFRLLRQKKPAADESPSIFGPPPS
jgi:hypothetical protein